MPLSQTIVTQSVVSSVVGEIVEKALLHSGSFRAM